MAAYRSDSVGRQLADLSAIASTVTCASPSRRSCLKTGVALGLGFAGWGIAAGGTTWSQDPKPTTDGKPEDAVSSAARRAGKRGVEDKELEPESILTYTDPKVQRYRCGLQLDTGRANCRGIVTTFPIPREWPEQQVRLVDQQISPMFTRWEIRELDGLVSQFVGQIGSLPPSSSVDALLTFELTRSLIAAPVSVEELKIPTKISRELRQFMGDSPYIDPQSARIRNAVKEIEGVAPEQPWKRVEAVYDWVRERVQYVEGDIKAADEALKDGTGDCEELTSVFIAICRAMRVPARMVHVLMHCYPEFYLEDAVGNGHWIPCQAAGTRQFGSMEEYRPILQKGDRFKPPEQSLQRYVAEYFKATAVQGGKPKPKFVQEVLD